MAEENNQQPVYKAVLDEKTFKVDKPYYVKNQLTGEISLFQPDKETSLVKQALKYVDQVIRGNVFAIDKKATDEQSQS